MNIDRQQLDDLNVVLNISINESDYKNKVEENIRNYRKNIQLQGFRKGQVPLSFIYKKYYRILVNKEIQHLIEQGINEYITKEDLQILATPLPKEENFIDPQAKNFFLAFELGLAPKFDINLDKLVIDYYHIQVKEEDLNNQIKKLRYRFGKFLYKKFVSQKDHIRVKINPLSHNELFRKNKEKKYTFAIADFSRETLSKFLQSKIGDRIKVNTSELFLDYDQWESFNQGSGGLHFEAYLTIEQIFEIQPARLDQEFFDKILGVAKVKSLEEFHEKIKQNLLQSYIFESNKFFLHLVFDHLYHQVHFNLPSDFLQRSMKKSQKESLSEEQFLQKYKQTEKALRYQLLENKLAQQLEIKVDPKELKDFAISLVYDQRNGNFINKADVSHQAEQILQNQKEALQIYNHLFKDRLIEALKARLTLKNKNIFWSDFTTILQKYRN